MADELDILYEYNNIVDEFERRLRHVFNNERRFMMPENPFTSKYCTIVII